MTWCRLAIGLFLPLAWAAWIMAGSKAVPRSKAAKEPHKKPSESNAAVDHGGMADILLSMQNRLKISQVFNELVGLIEAEPQINKDTKAQLKSIQIKVQFSIAKDIDLQADLPRVAPETWLQRENRKESPADFIMRVYRPWIGKGLSKPDLKRLDKSLYHVFYTWKSKGGILPEGFVLPTKQQVNDDQLARLGFNTDETGGVAGPLREAGRIYEVARRRTRRLG